jgi:hypothetical protein
LSPDVLSLRTFYPSGRFVTRRFVSTEVLSLSTFCPSKRFVPWTISGRNVSGSYVSGRFISGRSAPLDVLCHGPSPDVCNVSGSYVSGRFVSGRSFCLGTIFSPHLATVLLIVRVAVARVQTCAA